MIYTVLTRVCVCTSAGGMPSGGRHCSSTSCSSDTSFPKGSCSNVFLKTEENGDREETRLHFRIFLTFHLAFFNIFYKTFSLFPGLYEREKTDNNNKCRISQRTVCHLTVMLWMMSPSAIFSGQTKHDLLYSFTVFS